jgi:hypothetical protein
MKAKDLAKQLLQTPDLEIVMLDSEYNPEIAKGIEVGKVVDNLFWTCDYIYQMHQNVDSFEKIDLKEKYLKENACQYSTLEEYIIRSKSHQANQVAFLEKAAIAPFVLSLI